MSVFSPPEQRAVLHGISWQTYERMLADIGDRPVRLTYDGGTLEIMSPSQRHERLKKRMGRMIEAMAEELGIEVEPGGSTTWRREDHEKGLEPDECYWVQNERVVRDKDVDLAAGDPPPDLALEADVWRSSLDRMGIYAALGVPEVWRHDGQQLTVHLLRGDGTYRESDRSRCFPWLPVQDFARHIHRPEGVGETTWIKGFREWVRTVHRAS